MRVLRADVLGFCMGVRRAVDLACAEAERAAGAIGTQGQAAGAISQQSPAGAPGRVFTFGPLIHNPHALEELKTRGLEIMEKLPADLHGITLVIRAHGIDPSKEQEIKRCGGRIVDATCPRVKASQLKARDLEDSGYRLFLAGEEGHAEVLGIKGYSPGCIVVGNSEEAQSAAGNLHKREPDTKTALIGQTTISPEEYRAVGEEIQKYFSGLKVIDTICPATTDRQNSLRSLLKQVDAVIVAGGKESANTRRLLTIAQQHGKPCVQAESAADIPPEFFRFDTVGLCAGASTPDSVIDEIEKSLTQKAHAKTQR